MDVRVDGDQFGSLIGAAVLSQITGENRDKILKEAIQDLLSVKATGYGVASSPMQKAFNNAVESYARQFIEKQLESDTELSQHLQSVVTEAVKKVFVDAEARDKLVNKIANAITESFGPRY